MLDLVAQVAPSRSTILITGETGTGKELVAKAIHANSPRADQMFVAVNSGSLPPDLLESTLFGHVKGAFTSAMQTKKGYFEVADRGTIFFDEIGTIGPETQIKLLRVFEEKEFTPLGSTDPGQSGRAHSGGHQCRSARARSRRASSARTCTTGST
jgi:transcriptional regulator with GAF, ATPase, and Fis domain